MHVSPHLLYLYTCAKLNKLQTSLHYDLFILLHLKIYFILLLYYFIILYSIYYYYLYSQFYLYKDDQNQWLSNLFYEPNWLYASFFYSILLTFLFTSSEQLNKATNF